MSGLVKLAMLLSGSGGSDFRAGGRMSGCPAGCPGLHEMPDVRALGPDVRAGRVQLL